MENKMKLFAAAALLLTLAFSAGAKVAAAKTSAAKSETGASSDDASLAPEVDTEVIQDDSSNSVQGADDADTIDLTTVQNDDAGSAENSAEVFGPVQISDQKIDYTKIDMATDWRPDTYAALVFSTGGLIGELHSAGSENEKVLQRVQTLLGNAKNDQAQTDALVSQVNSRWRILTFLIGPNYSALKLIGSKSADLKNIATGINYTNNFIADQTLRETLVGVGGQLSAESLMYQKKAADLSSGASLFGGLFKFFAK